MPDTGISTSTGFAVVSSVLLGVVSFAVVTVCSTVVVSSVSFVNGSFSPVWVQDAERSIMKMSPKEMIFFNERFIEPPYGYVNHVFLSYRIFLYGPNLL